ncbi:transposase [Kitasatospora sp. NPDC057518]|uniref:transposase n=1 Tax=Kitasatospora sp. NPDC057518 TaxID=3346155 RepID=UPI00368EFE16
MSLRPKEPDEIPAETARVARAAFPKGSLAIRVRDELGVLFTDAQFADLFPARGKPAWSPGRLALVVVLQFVEGLTDRQAAEAVRARIDFKYALGLELGDPGFDFSVLSEFRDRLIEAEAGRRVLDGILSAAREKGLLMSAGRARTDSTHVLSAARQLCWLEKVAETLRSALNALAKAAPDWLVDIAEPDWFRHYSTKAEDSRFPQARTKRDGVGLRIGRDGMRLLEAVFSSAAPRDLRDLPEVEVLRRMWVQDFHLVDGEVMRRGPKDRPPGAMRLVTPYDIEARGSVKRDTYWDGYKVHLTETCEPDAPNLITNVVTTVDWDSQRVTCPNGRTNTGWRDDRSQHGLAVVRAQFSTRDCRPCPVVHNCVPALKDKGPAITLRPQRAHQELQRARALQQTEEWKERYKIRAGVEGTVSQGVNRCGLRRSRYRGLAKTGLQHQLTGAAINLARIDAHLTETPRARTRTSHFAVLGPAELMLSGAE